MTILAQFASDDSGARGRFAERNYGSFPRSLNEFAGAPGWGGPAERARYSVAIELGGNDGLDKSRDLVEIQGQLCQ